MIAKALYPPFNAYRQQAVVDLLSNRDDPDADLEYFCDLHQKFLKERGIGGT